MSFFDPPTVGGAERANRMFNCYGRNTFVALFWPAKSDERGVPDTTKSITDASPRVWETYKPVSVRPSISSGSR